MKKFTLAIFTALLALPSQAAVPTVGMIAWKKSHIIERGKVITTAYNRSEVIEERDVQPKHLVKTLKTDHAGRTMGYWQVYLPTERIFDERVLVDCVANGGTRESITVTAGTFETCKTVHQPNPHTKVEIWNGLVPFLQVKKISTYTPVKVPPHAGQNVEELIKISN